jgi:hypothetical protein
MFETNQLASVLKKPTSYFFSLAALVFLLVVILNDGFMALDEYWVGITRYIPAQTSSVNTLVGDDDVKSPLQMLPMHGVAQAALSMGVESPYAQYRIVIAVLALINFALMFYAVFEFAKVMGLTVAQRNFLLLMFTFYFGSSFSFTRPMYESISAPWLALAAVWALRYDFYSRGRDLFWGVIFASMAFVLRQQLGFCALVFIILPIMKKNIRHLALAAIVGLVFFILAGIPDYYIRGKFHLSLLNLTFYNYQHGSDYGRKPITFYPLLIVVMTFLPFLIKKYPSEVLLQSFKRLRTTWMILFLFVFLHSLFPQKWERFMISVIPTMLFLVFPYLLYLQQNFSQHKVRLISLYSLNGLVFFLASFFPPQKNLIEMSRYLNDHPEIKRIHRVNNTPEWITDAFVYNKLAEEEGLAKQQQLESRRVQPMGTGVVGTGAEGASAGTVAAGGADGANGTGPVPEPTVRSDRSDIKKGYEFIESNKALIADENWRDCSVALVLAKHDLPEYAEITSKLKLRAQFNVNLIEQLAYKLNPKNNARRVELNLFSGADCP